MIGAPNLNTKEAEIRFALRGVIDPEIGLSVVDVGLVYNISVEDDVAVITMTTTTKGCPATQFLVEAVRERALHTGAAKEVDVRLVYDPPWSPEMILSCTGIANG